MKTLKILGCIALIAAAVVYAAKVPTVFGPGVEGFLKYPKSVVPVPTYTNVGNWVIFNGTDAKTSIQFTKLDNANLLIYPTIKGISVKLPKGYVGVASNVLFGTSTATPDTDWIPGGNYKLNVKLKGINVGTVAGTQLNVVQVQSLFGGFAGKRTNPNNAKEMGVGFTAFGGIRGADGTQRVLFGNIWGIPTQVKGVSAKDKVIGQIQWVDARQCGVPAGKETKIKWTAKVINVAGADILTAMVNPFSPKSKNVTFTPTP